MAEINAMDLIQKDFLKIDKNDSLSKLIGLIVSSGKENALVFDGKKYYGMVSKRSIVRKRVNLSQVKIGSIAEKYPEISKNDSLLEIAEAMYSSDARVLPVVDGGNVLGIISSVALVKQLKNLQELKNLPAKSIASTNVFFLTEKDSLGKALSIMKEKNIKKIPILDSNRKILGIVRFEDIMIAYLKWASNQEGAFKENYQFHTSEKGSALESLVGNELNSNVAIVDENASLEDISKRIEKEDSSVLISKNNLIVGIITNRDLLSSFLKLKELPAEPRNIQLINVPQVDEIDYAKIEKTIWGFYDKAKQKIHNEVLMIVHFKQHSKSQLKTMHSVHIRLSFPGVKIIATHSDWNLITALQETISNVTVEMQKQLEQK